jgi:hypothetical protein
VVLPPNVSESHQARALETWRDEPATKIGHWRDLDAETVAERIVPA